MCPPDSPPGTRRAPSAGHRGHGGSGVDLLVLAGGRGERLGGREKAELVLEGRSLLERVLAAAPTLGGEVVVVGRTPVPAGVLTTLEDPPDGGPVAGIAAGLAALDAARRPGGRRPAPWVAVAAVDQPTAAAALTSLQEALAEVADDVEALSHADPEGHRQWLLALYRRPALRAALAALPSPRHTSVRRLVADLSWETVERGAEHVGDVDTWDDVAAWERRLTGGTTPPAVG